MRTLALFLLLTACGSPAINERGFGSSDGTNGGAVPVALRFELSEAMSQVSSFKLRIGCEGIRAFEFTTSNFNLPKMAKGCQTQLLEITLDGVTFYPASTVKLNSSNTSEFKSKDGAKVFAVLDTALAKELSSGQEILFLLSNSILHKVLLQDLAITSPEGWDIAQRVKDASTIILRFKNGEKTFVVYVKKSDGSSIKDIFAAEAKVVKDDHVDSLNDMDWSRMTTSVDFTGKNLKYFVSGFMGEKNGFTYFGFSRDEDQSVAEENTTAFLKQAKFAK